jgi:methyl-accepting chemotaxis protein
VTVQASRVARSTAEQSLGAQQISEAINRIQKITEDTADVSVEMDKSVAVFKQNADVLNRELDGFKL